MRRRGTRAVCSWQGAVGLATVAGAPALSRRIGGRTGRPTWLAPLIAVLGLRQVAQAALVYTVDDPLFLRAGAAVDGLHAASMVPVLFLPRYRTAAGVSAVMAAAAAVVQMAVADRAA